MVAQGPPEEEEVVMSYTSRMSRRGRGIFAASGLGGHGYYGRDYRGLFGLGSLLGLGQAKTGGAAAPDHTASDWATALTTGGSLVSSIVGAATGQQTGTPAATTPTPEPTPTAAPPVSASPSWYWPVVIGVGVAVLGGIGYMSYNVKAPVKANRMRRNKARSRFQHFVGTHHSAAAAQEALARLGRPGRVVQVGDLHVVLTAKPRRRR
jgi:hypothetical protein